ncbi:LytTR family DNA-binding domain-containing protein [Aliibacillus thermotolerans]|uniref:LytTR family DNA-binding domain-containing protein n=1 Tax=Aliibacillus thermotolerans TaxID=1834418 RepID=A0ABW0U2I5_9BACI|nr:LytTR family DNA-binding domain-containing protein [Aliibacillus thermotolerans]
MSGQLSVVSVIETFKDLFPKDTSIAVSDEKQYIYYKPGKKIDLKIKPGDIVKKETVTYKALAKQRKASEYIHKQVFGVPYFGISSPVLDDGELAGCVTAIFPVGQGRLLSQFLTIRLEDRWRPVPNKNIIYIEAQNRRTWVHPVDGETGYHTSTLNELEFFLPEDAFIRTHRSYIVNINFIKEIQPDSHSTFLLIMSDNTKVPVSQSHAKHFRDVLGF